MKQAKKILAVLITLALIAGIVGSVIYAVQRSSRCWIQLRRGQYYGRVCDCGCCSECILYR